MQQCRVPARSCCLEVPALEIVFGRIRERGRKNAGVGGPDLSLPAEGRRVRRLSAVFPESGAKFRKKC